MKKTKTPKMFKTEADLCTAFIASIDSDRWTPYAETAGWDILLARKADGFQIGIQAKQKMNTDVVNQTIEEYRNYGSAERPGPDCRAVLVPSSAGFRIICQYLAVVIIEPIQQMNASRWRFSPSLPLAPPGYDNGEWPEWAPMKRHALPDYVPDVRAGASAPTQLTDWKIKALKLEVLLDRHGSVTRADFSHLRLDYRRWIASGWIRLEGGVFVAGDQPGFKAMHPRVYGEIRDDFEKWKPAERAIALPLQQQELL